MANRRKLATLLAVLALVLVSVANWYVWSPRPPSGAGAPPAVSMSAALAAVVLPSASSEPSVVQPAAVVLPPPPPSVPGARLRVRAAATSSPNEEPIPEPSAPEPPPSAVPVVSATPPPSAAAAVPEEPVRVPSAALTGLCHNAVGGSFRLVQVTYVLDGETVLSDRSARLAEAMDFEAFRRTVAPGEHTLSVVAELRGNGGGLFSYYDSYRYKVQASHRIAVHDGQATVVTVSLFEKRGPASAPEERLGIGFRVNTP
jgi:hypothetical protein